MQTYTDQQVAAALAALEVNAGNVQRTALALGIPRTTLIEWRDRSADTVDSKTDTPSKSIPPSVLAERPHDFAGMWGEVQELAAARMRELIPEEKDLRAVAIAAGIAADKHLDYTAGRRGMGPSAVVQNNVSELNITVRYDYTEPRH